MKWHDIDQANDEDKWLDLRIGKVGGSSIGKIMANYGKAFGQPAHKEALRIAIEKITSQRYGETYSNAHMERGHEQEPIARMLYEEQTFSKVSNGGYFDCSEYEGVSPDGLVYGDGLIEIKSVIGTEHFETIKRNSFNPAYKWQLYFNLKCSGRKWIDYVEYSSDFPSGKQLFVQRVYADKCSDEFVMINARMSEFIKLVKSKVDVINNIK